MNILHTYSVYFVELLNFLHRKICILDEAEAQKRHNSEALAVANEHISKLVGENEKLRSEVESIRLKSSGDQHEKAENEHLNITLQELRQELQKANCTNSELTAKMEQFRKGNATLTESLKVAEDTNRTLMVAHQTLKSELTKQEAKMSEAKKIIAICLRNEDNDIFGLTNENFGSRRKSLQKVSTSTPWVISIFTQS